MAFPEERPRRLRQHPTLRRLVRETRLSPDQLVQPLFLVPGEGVQRPIASLAGQSQYSVDRIVEAAKQTYDAGVSAVLLFGTPAQKDAGASGAYADDGIVQNACRMLRECVPGLIIMTDVCLCAYMDHGHCGVVRRAPCATRHVHKSEGSAHSAQRAAHSEIDNDASLDLLAKTAVSHAMAGAHVVAPSDMMDGRVGVIREALDEVDLTDTVLMSYAVKYASAFYGPFREAQDSAPEDGDRQSYQMDPANAREALREVRLDVAEGADIVMVKPALPYLDILRDVRAEVDVPIAAYQVSGEYAMIHNAATQGLLDGPRAMRESLTAIRRAGADLIITYAATDVAQSL
jgi:porphobilinogen synthase